MKQEHPYVPVLGEEERNRILMEQMPQVRYIARNIHDRLPQHVPLEDLVHAGVLGLIDALDKYDQARHVQFKTYAKFRIRGAILDSLRELDWSPRDLRRKARQIEEVTNRLGNELGRAATEQEIADALSMSLDDFHRVLSELEGLDLGSFHVESSGGDREEDLCEYVPGDPNENPFFLCMRSELRDYLRRAIEELSEREQQVLSLYYFEELTMKEVGAVLGVGESRVSQMHSLALLRLRAKLTDLLSTRAVPAHLADAAVRSAMEGMWRRY